MFASVSGFQRKH